MEVTGNSSSPSSSSSLINVILFFRIIELVYLGSLTDGAKLYNPEEEDAAFIRLLTTRAMTNSR